MGVILAKERGFFPEIVYFGGQKGSFWGYFGGILGKEIGFFPEIVYFGGIFGGQKRVILGKEIRFFPEIVYFGGQKWSKKVDFWGFWAENDRFLGFR